MAKIREDLVGVVQLGDGTVLSAGDVIPDGVEVGDHLIESKAETKPTRSRTNTAK